MIERVPVTVIVPTCNRPEFLRRAVGSVNDQTRHPMQIVIVEDSDHGAKQSDRSTGLPDGIAWITTPRPKSGASHARNAGAQLAQGTYLAFLDDDDWWDPEFLERLVDAAISTGAELVCAGFWDVDAQGVIQPGKLPPVRIEPHHVLLRNPGFTGSNFIIRRDTFSRLGGFDPLLFTSNDREFLLRALDAQVSTCCVRERLVYRNNHGSDRLTRVSRRKILSSARFHRRLSGRFTDHERRLNRAKIDLLLYRYFRERGYVTKALGFLRHAVSCSPRYSIDAVIHGRYV